MVLKPHIVSFSMGETKNNLLFVVHLSSYHVKTTKCGNV
nr:MAG TPA: hypothetical protein [Caudoviricetes sp.]